MKGILLFLLVISGILSGYSSLTSTQSQEVYVKKDPKKLTVEEIKNMAWEERRKLGSLSSEILGKMSVEQLRAIEPSYGGDKVDNTIKHSKVDSSQVGNNFNFSNEAKYALSNTKYKGKGIVMFRGKDGLIYPVGSKHLK